MLHGILFILKIIGILLLTVLGLIFAVTLLVLLTPVRYRIEASVLEKNPDVDLRVTWLFRLLSVRARYHPDRGPFDLSVRILGIRLGGRKKSGKDGDRAKDEDGDRRLRTQVEEETEPEDGDDEFGEEQLLELLEKGLEDADGLPEETAEGNAGAMESDDMPADRGNGVAQDDRLMADVEKTSADAEKIFADVEKTSVNTDKALENAGEKAAKTSEMMAEPDEEDWERLFAENETDSEASDMGESFGTEKEKSSVINRLKKIIDKILNSFQSIPEKVEKLKRGIEKLAEKKNSLMEFIQDADNQSLFRLLLKQTGGVFRHIRPRKLKLYLHFGFTDPSITGKLLGYASVFYAYYYKTVDLVPEFQTDTLILEGNLYAKGRIRAGTLLCKGVRLLFNRGCRKMIKRVLKR